MTETSEAPAKVIVIYPPIIGSRRVHAKGCSGRLKVRWSGMRCDCGARWECY